MSRLVHALGHVVLIVAGFIVTYNGYVPPKYAPVILAAQGLIQALLALKNHK